MYDGCLAVAQGEYLDRIGELHGIKRKKYRRWYLFKFDYECDVDFRARVLAKARSDYHGKREEYGSSSSKK